MIHFGKYAFNKDVIDYIELQGNGTYVIHLHSGAGVPQRSVEIFGLDAEALREWLDADRRDEQIASEIEEAHLKSHQSDH